MGDSKEKKLVQVSFKIRKDFYDKVKGQVAKQGEKEITPMGYYLIGILYVHDIFRTNPQLALDVVSRVQFGRGGGSEQVERILRRLVRKVAGERGKGENLERED